MNKELLQEYIQEGLSSYKIAELTQKSPTTVRYWINKYKISLPKSITDKLCPSCNLLLPRTQFYSRRNKAGTGVYCRKCTSLQTLLRQRNNKKLLVDYMGGKCQRCGYNNCLGALQVHHLNPSIKNKSFRTFKMRIFDDRFKEELKMCELLCANCHLEEHTQYC